MQRGATLPFWASSGHARSLAWHNSLGVSRARGLRHDTDTNDTAGDDSR